MAYRKKARVSIWFVALVVWALTALICAPVKAQVVGATLSGSVTDTSGGVIPNAKLSIKNVATQVMRSATTDSAGFYTAPNLLPGTYQVTITAQGFQTEVRSGITLTVGTQQSLNITMQVGQITQTVEVTTETPAVELASSSIGGVVTQQTVVELPLNGRSWSDLAELQPSVNVVQTQISPQSATAPKSNRGYGNELTVAGTRPQTNNYRLDGISIVDYAEGSPGSVIGITLGVDAVGEFSVLTSNYSAEYGRTSGGVINAITRSGSNQFHGNAYWFLRDEGLDAKTFVDAQRPPFHRNQFGASFGGPIQHDKTFFFANYEGFRQALGATFRNKVPSADARNGIWHNADGTTCTIGVVSGSCTLTNASGTVGVDPKVQPFLALWPMLNTSDVLNNGNIGIYSDATNTTDSENFVTSRIDRKFSDKDSLSGTFFYDKASRQAPDSLLTVLDGNSSMRGMFTVEETHIFSPALVNSARVGYSRVHVIQGLPIRALAPVAGDTSGIVSALPGRAAPDISTSGVITEFKGGLGSASLIKQPWNSIQFYDDVSLTKGVHALKFGFTMENMRHNPFQGSILSGKFSFGGLLTFLENRPNNAALPGRQPELGLRQTLYAAYIQDDWRFRPSLTLNLGLRYEMTTDLHEAHNWLSNLRNLTDTTPDLGAPIIQNPTLRNFEPRVGFAWDPSHRGKMSVRGAFGMFDVLPLSALFFTDEETVAPFTTQVQRNISQPSAACPACGPGSFPGIATTLLNSVSLDALGYSYYEFRPHRNYVMVWNLNVQRELSPSTTVMVGYVGNRGVHMFNRTGDGNMALPTTTPAGLLWPCGPGLDPFGYCATQNGQTLNPTLTGGISVNFWGGTASYNALEASVSKRFSHGFQAGGSFTWGKNIDTGSATDISDPFTNSISSLLWFCDRCRRGVSDFNVGRNLTINYIWDVPTPRWGSLASHVLAGWEVGGIFTAHDGVPVTPMIAPDPLGQLSNDPFDYPARVPGCNPVNSNFKQLGLSYINVKCFTLPAATPAIAAQCEPFGPSQGSPVIPGTCSNLMGNAGRNSIIGPGLMNFDFSLIKNTHIRRISENFNVQFRAEFFNIFNRANFQTPVNDNVLFNADGTPAGSGVLDQMATDARQIQFALKVVW
jgi:hypothetical protein